MAGHDPAGLDREVLGHEAWPGYGRVFALVFTAAVIYLLVVFIATTAGGMGAVEHHGSAPAGSHGPTDPGAGHTDPPPADPHGGPHGPGH